VKILALELSSGRGSLAWREGNFEWTSKWANDRKNSGEFFQNVAEAQKRFGAQDRIVVGVGPGSYAEDRANCPISDAQVSAWKTKAATLNALGVAGQAAFIFKHAKP
jgi:hypothetical protein